MAPTPFTQPQDGPRINGSWLDLPPEIRLKVLDLVSQEDRNTHIVSKRDPEYLLALYATVCPEWQNFFENITFRHLLVNNTDLADFTHIMSGKNTHRTDYVHHILFLIVLPGYSCPSCHKLETWFEIYRNNKIFSDAMERLLGILSTWIPRDHSGGVTLELGIKSCSDSRHFYRDITIDDDYPFKSWDFDSLEDVDELATMQLFHMNTVHDAGHQNRRRHFQSILSDMRRPEGFHASRRYLGTLLQFQGLRKSRLLRAEAIKSLLIRHQFKRQLSPLTLTKLLQESLVHVTSFRLERWCRRTIEEEEKYLQDFRKYLLPSLPETLQSFHYFAENLTEHFLPKRAQARSLSVPELLYTYGHRFKEISVVEPSGAKIAEFPCFATRTMIEPSLPAHWHKLERVCFRSDILHHDNDPCRIKDLLLLTAPVAETLPNLRSLEIFNTETDAKGEIFPSCLFRYSIQHSDAILSWESTWQLPLDTKTAEFSFCPEVRSAWEKTAFTHTGHGITILINEPKQKKEQEFMLRMEFWQMGKFRLAEDFQLDGIHPFTRVLMSLRCNRNNIW